MARISNCGRPTGRLRDDKDLSAGRLELTLGSPVRVEAKKAHQARWKAVKHEMMSRFQPQASGQKFPEGLIPLGAEEAHQPPRISRRPLLEGCTSFCSSKLPGRRNQREETCVSPG